ncbi:MAG: bifunctional riboflavin kinase/FAD synthetase [Verrucomicrobiota bacterium]
MLEPEARIPVVNIIHAAHELNPGTRKACLAIGVFDGVHLGHQQVIRRTIADSRQHEAISVAVTFDCHPNSVVAPERTPPLIYPLSKKLEVISSLGVDTALLLHFDKPMSQVPAEEFIRGLAQRCKNLHSICVGSTFTFGHKRQGNVEMLKILGRELHFEVHGLSAVSLDGERVSSTRIREAVRAGNLDAASQMLGRAYSLAGKIVEGDQIGRTLGFPTANLESADLVLPPNGVYAAHAEVSGKTCRAAVNIGVRPTMESPTPRLHVEAHLLDFAGELYGKEIELTFVEKLRDEKKFPSLEELKQQIRKDIEAAKKLF